MIGRQTALRTVISAIDSVRQAISTGKADDYVGIKKILQELYSMKEEIEANRYKTGSSGVGRQVVDQWPFSELGEEVLAADEAYKTMSQRHSTNTLPK